MQVLCTTVPRELAGRSVAAVLRERFSVSSALLRRTREVPGAILRNGAPVALRALCAEGDTLHMDVRDLCPPHPQTDAVPARVLWRDEWMLFADKPGGLLSHASTFTPGEETMEERVAALPGGISAYHPVNRLDRGTSGVMCVALCGYLHERLKVQLHTPDFVRAYLCLCDGEPPERHGTVSAPIGRADGSVLARCVRPDGKPAETEWHCLSAGNGRSLLLVLPRTGRTHQIRVHMREISCPLAGDFLYGSEESFSRTALHSALAVVRHPVSGERITVFAPPPEDFAALARTSGLNIPNSEEVLLCLSRFA